MAHGQHDFGMYAAKKTLGSIADNAELAARLGSIVTFDRRGDVLWWDDFEDNAAKWTPDYVPAGGTWALSAVRALLGGNSGALGTAAAIGATAEVVRAVFYPVASKVGYEIAFNLPLGGYPIVFRIRIDDRVDSTDFLIRYNYNTSVLELETTLGVVVVIDPAFVLRTAGTGFHILKLVIDMTTLMFVKLILDDYTFDISAYAGNRIGAPVATGINLYALATSALAAGIIMYLGHCIFTQNEP